MVDLIVSINIYREKYFNRILNEIETMVQDINYKIIISCSNGDNMKYFIDNYKNDERIILNPKIIKKGRFHGSLTQGIISNMNYIKKEKINYKYFFVISNRTILLEEMKIKKNVLTGNMEEYSSGFVGFESMSDIITRNNILIEGCRERKLKKICNLNNGFNEDYPTIPVWSTGPQHGPWHWSNWEKTKIYKKLSEGMIYGSYHEGLFFPMNSVLGILDFFKNNIELYIDTINYPTNMEEFVLQSLCVLKNLEFGNMKLRRFNYE